MIPRTAPNWNAEATKSRRPAQKTTRRPATAGLSIDLIFSVTFRAACGFAASYPAGLGAGADSAGLAGAAAAGLGAALDSAGFGAGGAAGGAGLAAGAGAGISSYGLVDGGGGTCGLPTIPALAAPGAQQLAAGAAQVGAGAQQTRAGAQHAGWAGAQHVGAGAQQLVGAQHRLRACASPAAMLSRAITDARQASLFMIDPLLLQVVKPQTPSAAYLA